MTGHDGGPGARPRRRRPRNWLGIGTCGALVAVAAAACAPAAGHPASSHPSASKPSAGRASASTSLSGSALGPSACVTGGQPAGGSGPYKIVTPGTLCGLPLDNSAQDQQSGQALASEYQILISMNNVGTVTSTTTLNYQSPPTPGLDRSVSFVGFEGAFRPAAAVSTIEGTVYPFTSLSPGPHGGALGCANEEGTEECVWATRTTLCTVLILDSTNELLGANIAANAVRIRDALEQPG